MQSSDLPIAFESVTGLGSPMRLFRVGWFQRIVHLGGAALAGLAAAAAAYYGLVSYPRIYPDVAETNVPWIIGFALLIAAGAGYWAWWILRRWNTAAVVYSDGLAYFHGGDLRQWRWKEIAALTFKVMTFTVYGVIPAGTIRNYVLRDREGKSLKLDGAIGKVDALMGILREKTFPHLLDEAVRTVESGGEAAFGPFFIGKTQGVRMGKKAYSWKEISGVSAADAVVTVRPKKGELFGGGMSAPIDQVPNADVFLALAAELQKQAGA